MNNRSNLESAMSNDLTIKGQTHKVSVLGDLVLLVCRLLHEPGFREQAAIKAGRKYGLLDSNGRATGKYFAFVNDDVAQLTQTLATVTFKDFANLAKRRGHTPESLAALFRGKVDEPRAFFERVMSCRYKGEDRSDVVIPYRSVIDFYQREANSWTELKPGQRTCACGCRLPVFDRKKWAAPGCRQRVVRGKGVSGVHFASC